MDNGPHLAAACYIPGTSSCCSIQVQFRALRSGFDQGSKALRGAFRSKSSLVASVYTGTFFTAAVGLIINHQHELPKVTFWLWERDPDI